jgi:hypothetical protein
VTTSSQPPQPVDQPDVPPGLLVRLGAVTSLTPERAGPDALSAHIRNHWSCENKTHYVRDVTFNEDPSQVRTGSAPQALAALRNLVIGVFRIAGYANMAFARRECGNDKTLILRLFNLLPNTV